MSVSEEPPADLRELTGRLTGRWRVTGPGIEGLAEYRPVHDGWLLVGDVDFVVDGTAIKNIQQIAHDQETGTLRARYLDTTGGAATYIWALDGPRFRVTLEGADSDTYFEATFAPDSSEYHGTWHYPSVVDAGPDDEPIVYTRIVD